MMGRFPYAQQVLGGRVGIPVDCVPFSWMNLSQLVLLNVNPERSLPLTCRCHFPA